MKLQSSKRVICLSWVPELAVTRRMMLTGAGYEVSSLVGHDEVDQCAIAADLLLLAHSVPLHEKQRAIELFRAVCNAPVLSLLRAHQQKILEADYGIESHSPSDLLAAVKRIL